MEFGWALNKVMEPLISRQPSWFVGFSKQQLELQPQQISSSMAQPIQTGIWVDTVLGQIQMMELAQQLHHSPIHCTLMQIFQIQ